MPVKLLARAPLLDLAVEIVAVEPPDGVEVFAQGEERRTRRV